VIDTLCPCTKAAHKHCSKHRKEILASKTCGCFYCSRVFIPSKIVEWVDKGTTALCPHCGIDSVIGTKSGYPITKEFLIEMYQRWFNVFPRKG